MKTTAQTKTSKPGATKMNIQTLYYLEITSEDIQAAAAAKAESRSQTCPISQAMRKIFQESVATAETWTSFKNSTTGKWHKFSGHNDCIGKFTDAADGEKGAFPTILLLEEVL